ncbi:MAG: hypothetical protein Q8P82_01340 [bacterium]|nr:hypothetical protein [bacterium]
MCVRKKKRRVFTHGNMDLDANASVFAWRQVDPDAELVLVSANWDGTGMEKDDVALDIEAGDRGIKGTVMADGVRHSAFAEIVAKHLKRKAREQLAPLVAFIDAQDTFGDAYEYLAPNASPSTREMLSSTGINAVLRALQTVLREDRAVHERMSEIFAGMQQAIVLPNAPLMLARMAMQWLVRTYPRTRLTDGDFETRVIRHCPTEDTQALIPFIAFIKLCETNPPVSLLASVVPREALPVLEATSLVGVFRALVAVHGEGATLEERMFQLFDGLIQNGIKRLYAQHEARETPIMAGRVAILEEPKYSGTSLALIRHHGVDAVVYKRGNNIGVRSRKGLHIWMDHPLIREAVGSEPDWFFHPEGFLAARGTRKAPSMSPSKIDPVHLALAVLRALESADAGD